MPDVNDTFPGRLAELRGERGWSQQELALRAGLSLFTVSKLEQDSRAPSLDTACRLADALGVSLDSLRATAKNGAEKRSRGRPKNNPKK